MSEVQFETESPVPVEAQAQAGQRGRTRNLATASLVAAVMAAAGWVSIPIPGAVPVTLQTFGVVLAALLLAPEWAAVSMAIYVFLGAIGVPVFAGGQAGLGVVFGPTGGYITGFILAAYVGALVRTRLTRSGSKQLIADVAAAIVAIAAVYLVGWAQLALVLGLSPLKAFGIGVAPFLVPDAVKAGVAILIATAVRRSQQPV
jgi:biotin transport system substrate-specific component